ncbi:lytic polysaccharide monooxygenase auxiliary activity family 9 protein [Streptomyces boninensis]|uniref:lytic polysaccharide monooxygenase auxiliary activity family 9 protein n=1 Tax=Streptomyces boninensis TaxID=2039455 RepID=UPI003B20E8D3
MHIRRLLALPATAALALLIALTPTPAAAHGVAMDPGSRTYLCYLDLLQNSSTQMPSNPACAAAVRAASTTPLYNWFAVLDSNAGGKGQGYVPDGKLCSAGDKSPYNFSPYNAVRSDWPKTHLTSGANIQLQYSNWAHHPGRFEVYITNSGWSPSSPLAWGDLTHLQTVNDPPQAGGGPGSNGGHYYWDLKLPARSGEHMLFIQWIRSDSQENFFSCSDVVFDGGQGEVTGLGGGTKSAEEISAAAADAKGSKAAQAVAHHGDHSGHAADVADVADVADTASQAPESSTGTSLILPVTTATLVAAAGVLLYFRRNRPDRNPMA